MRVGWRLDRAGARYAAVGKTRESSEKELILCNLIARRKAMLEFGGFNEALYPNEENALMDELQKGGGKLLYDPQMIVHRRPRHTLKAFAKMLLNYGRGRAEQFRLHPTPGPRRILCRRCFARIWWRRYSWANWGWCRWRFMAWRCWRRRWRWWPRAGVVRSLCAIPLIVLTHILYGIGFWRGLFTRLHTPGGARQGAQVQVVLETVQL